MLDTDCYPHTNQGASVQTWELSRELARRGHEVSILRRSEINSTEIVDNVSLIGVKFKGLENIVSFRYLSVPFHLVRLFSSLYFSKQAEKILTKSKIDNIIILVDRVSGYFPARLRQRKIFIMHVPEALDFLKDQVVHANYLNSIGFFFKKNAEQKIIERVDRIVTLNSYVQEFLENNACLSKKVVRIANGINPSDFQNIADCNYILYAGRFDWNKNVSELVEAFSSISEPLLHYHLRLVGAGPEEDKIRDIVKKMRLEKKVKISKLLPRKDLCQIIGNCSLLVLPSLFEAANPIVVMEAMACSKPVIARRNMGSRDLIVHGKNGYLYSDKKELESYLQLLLLDKPLRTEIGDNARKCIESNYSTTKIANQYESMLQEL
jgi:glycosyltransferase involved in cell wall biosynthesis